MSQKKAAKYKCVFCLQPLCLVEIYVIVQGIVRKTRSGTASHQNRYHFHEACAKGFLNGRTERKPYGDHP